MLNLGTVKPGSTIRIPFSSFDKDDGSAITMTNYAVGDILVYKDGGTTERASTSGYAATTDFDGKTGKHLAVIDLADNTTADFFQAGSEYLVAIDSVTIDAVTTGGWIGRFTIGYPDANLDTFIATLTNQTSFTLNEGPAEDDAINGHWAVIHDAASKVQRATVRVLDYTGSTKTVTLVAGATFTVAAKDNFSLMDLAPLQPATLGRTLVVDSAGLADANMVKVGPTGSGTAQTAGDIMADTNDIQARLPAALVSGRMDSSVGAMAADTITASAIATDAIGALELAAGAASEIATAVRTELTTELGRIDVATSTRASQTSVDTIDDFVDTEVAAIKAVTDKLNTMVSINSDSNYIFTTDAVEPVWAAVTRELTAIDEDRTTMDIDNAVRAAVGLATANLDTQLDALPTAAENATSVWAAGTRSLTILDEDSTTLDLDATIRAAVGLASANLDTQLDALPTAAENATSVWAAGTRTLTALDEDNTTLDLDATIRSAMGLASANLDTQLGAIDDFIDTEVAAIKAVTDKLDNTLENTSDGYIFTVNALQQAPTGGSAPSAAAIADAVWEEAIADHSGTAGSTAEALAAAGSAGDPWITALPGAYSAGQAGFILGTNLNATVSSRATQTSVDTIDDFLDTEIAAIKAKTDNLPTDPADASDIAASFATVNTKLDTIDDFVDTEVAAIKAKTDNLPTDPADQSLIIAATDAIAALIGTPAGISVSADVAAVKSDTGAIKAKTDNLPSDPADASVVAGLIAAVPAGVWTVAVDGATTAAQSMAIQNSVLAGNSSGHDTLSPVFRDLADTKDRVTGDLDTFGNRTNTTTDGT